MSSTFELEWSEEGENKVQEFLNCRHTLHSASLFYRKMSNIQTRMCESLRLIWQKDLGGEISDDVWQDVISNVGWATRDARSKFIHYKVVHRYYFTPLKLFKMGLTQDSKCWKCHKELGTFLHAIWDCPMVLLGSYYATGRAHINREFVFMTETAAFEKMIARVNNILSKMSQVWEAFVDYIKDVTL